MNPELTQQMLAPFVRYVPALMTAPLPLLLGSVESKFLACSALLTTVNAHWAVRALRRIPTLL